MNKLLHYSYINKLSHIPSALSMYNYIEILFKDKWVTKDDFIVLGKPFGAQAYYLVWQKYLGLKNIEKLGTGVKHDEIDFVDYSEETIGNALGVASGIAMTTDKKVWVNLSDGSLQMGNTLEAIQFIGQHQLENILVTIDWNEQQVTGCTKNIIDINPIKYMFVEYNWNIVTCNNAHDYSKISKSLKQAHEYVGPTVIIMKTLKGAGSPTLHQKKWHYRKIESLDELILLDNELIQRKNT